MNNSLIVNHAISIRLLDSKSGGVDPIFQALHPVPPIGINHLRNDHLERFLYIILTFYPFIFLSAARLEIEDDVEVHVIRGPLLSYVHGWRY